jgi:hypothetical protein
MKEGQLCHRWWLSALNLPRNLKRSKLRKAQSQFTIVMLRQRLMDSASTSFRRIERMIALEETFLVS